MNELEDRKYRGSVEFDYKKAHQSVMNLQRLLEEKKVNELDLVRSYKKYIEDEEYGKAKVVDLALKLVASKHNVSQVHNSIAHIICNIWKLLREARQDGFSGSYLEFFNSIDFENRVRKDIRAKA